MPPARCPSCPPLAVRLAVVALLLVPAAPAREIVVRPGDDLASILESCRGPAVIRLKPGEHRVSATPYSDARCANCENPATPCSATRGLLVTGRGIRIEGAGAERTVLRAEAGYGVLFEASEESARVTRARDDSPRGSTWVPMLPPR